MNRWIYRWLINDLEQQYGRERILYMDEAGLHSTERYAWGWNKRGHLCHLPKPGGRGQRRNFISAVSAVDKSWIMPWVLKGTVNRLVVEQWLIALGQSLRETDDQKPYILVWDNARFHKGGELKTIADKYNIRIVHLPVYSPDLNPIEQCWSTLKHKIRLKLGNNIPLDEAIDQVFSV